MLARYTRTDSPTTREINDVRALRALAHPLRVRLYELTAREGTLTSTEAAALTGESSASCSFHLRQLAKYGFIEQAPGSGGRERRWRRTAAVNALRPVEGDGAFAVAERAAASLLARQTLDQLDDYLRRADDDPADWQAGSFIHDSLLYLTPSELSDLKSQVLDLAARYQQRTIEISQRPGDSTPVAFFALGIPLVPTPDGN